jgi:hypothetical protein
VDSVIYLHPLLCLLARVTTRERNCERINSLQLAAAPEFHPRLRAAAPAVSSESSA